MGTTVTSISRKINQGAQGGIGRIKTDGTGFNDGSDGFNDPQGIIAAPDGNLYFAERSNQSIDKKAIGPVTGGATKVALTGPPSELCYGNDGYIYFTEPTANKIGKIKTDGTGLV